MSRSPANLSNRVLAASLACAVLAGCAAQPTEEEVRDKYQAIPIARVVGDADYVPSPKFADQMFYQSKVEYNETYRKPDQPMPLPVDCLDTEKIGVYYALVTQKHPRGRRIKVRYVWAHDSMDSDDPKLDHMHSVYIQARGYQWIVNEILDLKNEFRVDGVFKLTALIDGYPILENAFELVGCSE